MFEMSTESISRDLLKEMIAKAKECRGFKTRSEERTYFEIRKNRLPDLQGYVLSRKTPVANVNGIADCPLDVFFRVSEVLKTFVERCGVSYKIDQSGEGFDPEEEFDLELMVRYDSNTGWGIMLSIGALSVGCKNLLFRADIFRNFVQCAGLSDLVKIRCAENNLYLDSETVKCTENFLKSASSKASDIGSCIYWASGGQIFRTDSGIFEAKNFSILAFYFPDYNDFLVASRKCKEHFCSLGSIARSELWMRDYSGDYEELRTFLGSNFPCDDWRLMISGRSKYGIDDLDKMFEETDSLLLPLFVITDQRVGDIDMELGYDKGALTLNFSTHTEEIDKAEKVIRQIVAELSDGKAVINEEV
jgi:hypothetical protein